VATAGPEQRHDGRLTFAAVGAGGVPLVLLATWAALTITG